MEPKKYKKGIYKVTAYSIEEASLKIKELEKQEALAMSKMIPTETGLQTVIWVDAEKAYKKGKHAKRIKFKAGKSESSKTFTSIMLRDAKVVEETLPKKKSDRIDSSIIENICVWVRNNEYALEKLSDSLITQTQFSKILIKGYKKAATNTIKTLKEKVDKLIEFNKQNKW